MVSAAEKSIAHILFQLGQDMETVLNTLQAQLAQSRRRHTHSRRSRSAQPEDLEPKGPRPCLVIGPDGSHMTLAVQETLAEAPAAAAAAPRGMTGAPKQDSASAEAGTNQIQVGACQHTLGLHCQLCPGHRNQCVWEHVQGSSFAPRQADICGCF